MRIKRILSVLLVLVVVTGAVASDTLESQYRLNGKMVSSAFEPLVSAARKSVVRIMVEGKQVGMGTIVSSDGYILTRDESITANMGVSLLDGRSFRAKLVGVDKSNHVALLKIGATGLNAVQWGESQNLSLGAWVATPLPQGGIRVGIVSAARRKIAREGGVMGVSLDKMEESGGVPVSRVFPGSGAEKAGVKQDDVILAVNGHLTPNVAELREFVKTFEPGQTLKLKVKRQSKEMEIEVTLAPMGDVFDKFNKNAMLSRNTSKTRSGFNAVIQHDTPLDDAMMCGPLVDLDGKVVGINIARVDRVQTFSLPADAIEPIIENLKKSAETTAAVKSEPTGSKAE